MLLLVQGSAVDACGLTALTLSTSCNGLCDQYAPCVAFSALECPSGASCVTDNQCAIQCFPQALNDPETFTFLVEFGAYESSQEKQERTGSSGSSFEEQVDAIPEETDAYAAASNDAVANISTIALEPTATSL
jgi:hypothetical protein